MSLEVVLILFYGTHLRVVQAGPVQGLFESKDAVVIMIKLMIGMVVHRRDIGDALLVLAATLLFMTGLSSF